MDLYIVGNGFDINENLNTRYKDFYNYLVKNCSNLLDELELFYDSIFTDKKMEDGVVCFDRSILLKGSKLIYPSNEWLWGSLEKNIANISFSSIIQNFGLYRFPIKNTNNLIFDISVKYENEKVKLYIFNQKGGKHVEKDY